LCAPLDTIPTSELAALPASISICRRLVNHEMDGKDPAVDAAVFKSLYSLRQPIGQRSDRPVTSALGLLAGRR